jgi:hypothetical protein
MTIQVYPIAAEAKLKLTTDINGHMNRSEKGGFIMRRKRRRNERKTKRGTNTHRGKENRTTG